MHLILWTKKHLFLLVFLVAVLAILRIVNRDADNGSGLGWLRYNDVQSLGGDIIGLRSDADRETGPDSSPEVLTEYPEEFFIDFKNPCWLSSNGGKMKCLPYFYLAGMPKCGTTDIWNKLTRHPGIWKCSKEPHWWSKIRVSTYTGKSKMGADAGAYYGRWGKMMARVLRKEGVDTAENIILGDGSASTFWDNRFWTKSHPNNTLAPPSSTALLIHRIQPRAKIIIAFRDPVDRLYSDYQYLNKNSTITPKEFNEAVKLGIDEFQRCLGSVRDLRTCTYNPDTKLSTHTKAVRLRVGLYAVYYEDWLLHFPENQLLPIKTEHWSVDCPGILSRIHQFLDLDEQTLADRKRICGEKRSNVGNASRLGSMLPETKQRLYEFYSPYNKRLATLLNDENFVW